MRFYPTLNKYKSYNGNNTFNPETFRAYSYKWWLYVAKIDGVIVFNDFRYSRTTAKHQNQMRSVLEEIGVQYDTWWSVECPGGLQDLQSGIRLYTERIDTLQSEIDKKGSRRAKNEERKAQIRFNQTKIDMLKRLIKKGGVK